MVLVQHNNHSMLCHENGIARKVIEPRAVFDSSEARQWAARIRMFCARLRSCGVPVPRYYRVEIDDDGRIIESSTHCGVDLQKLLEQGALTSRWVARSIIKAIKGVLLQRSPEIGLDPHPANWCLGEDRKISYVDFFPVFILDGAEPLVGFPQPQHPTERALNYRRYYTALGIVRCLRFNLVRICGKHAEQEVLESIRDIIGQNGILSQIKRLPVEAIRSGRQDPVDVIPRLTPENLDDLREIAMEVSGQIKSADLLDETLKLTTMDFRIDRQIRALRFEEAKQLLLRHLM